MYKLDIELLHYINELLHDRERLLDEREIDSSDYELNFVLKQETEYEMDVVTKGQKIISKLIEEQIDQWKIMINKLESTRNYVGFMKRITLLFIEF